MFERMPNYKIFLSDEDKALLGKLAVENDISPSGIISAALQLYSGVAERNAFISRNEKTNRNP